MPWKEVHVEERSAATLKGRGLPARLAFAWTGIAVVFRREKSFRAQCLLAAAALAVTAAVRPGFLWTAMIAMSIALVLALELMNAALEYLADRLHPGIAEEIKACKDAAAGAVLLASLGSVAVGGMMMISQLGR